MDFIPGTTYYVLEEEEFEELMLLMREFEFEGDGLAEDFVLVDGKYYAELGAINTAEFNFIDQFGLISYYLYDKSTQSHHPA